MPKSLAVVVIHGMGSQKADFAEDCIEELSERVGPQADEIAWRPIHWQPLVEARQVAYMRRAKARPNDLDLVRLREFVISALGDAVAYRKDDSSDNTTYRDIHDLIDREIKDLLEVQLEGRPVPLVVLAHSLGGHIISNYIWDVRRQQPRPPTTFQRMETMAGMVTFGCNMPLFTFAYRDPRPIRFPGRSLNAELKRKARWLNFYDPDDILGFPLRAINDRYKSAVSQDIPINVGGIASSWNPVSHKGYWTDNDFTKPVAKFLRGLLP
jgi:hypothetical protein